MDDLETMRLGVCKEYGIQYYKAYTIEQTAGILKKDVSTIKRWKRTGVIFPVVDPSGKGLHLMGFQIADIILGVHKPWQNTQSENTGLETSGSPNETASSAELGMTKKPSKQDVLASAQKALK